METITSLSGTGWRLQGFYPNVPLLGNSMETGVTLQGLTEVIPAVVPGSVQNDLWRAGWIEDPYFAMNSLKAEWIENRWWLYARTFDYALQAGEQVHLHFLGLDYKARIYLNHKLLAEHENMFVPLVLDVTADLLSEKNELVVLFEHAPDETGQIGYTSRTFTQKSRFAYKWDFSTRMVPLGLWDDVFLKATRGVKLDQVWLKPELSADLCNGKLIVEVEALSDGAAYQHYECEVSLSDASVATAANFSNPAPEGNDVKAGSIVSVLSVGLQHQDGKRVTASVVFEIANPQLWYANGQGQQALYTVEVKLKQRQSADVGDSWRGRTGFRQLNWIRSSEAGEDAIPYTPVINGEAVYIKGVNMTPLDVLYGSVDEQRYRHIVALMKAGNVNLVRVWGGGLIEKELFYDLCDEAGILIWQEFIQSSSGVDNVPSKLERFLELLEQTATQALLVKRNHTALACWSGGNELTDADGVPATYDDQNIALLKRLVEQYDPGRYFLPTSASGPNEFLQVDQPGRNHDVHGPWKYSGPEEHYRLFNLSDSMLHSEFGVDGASSMQAIKRFLPERDQIVTTMRDNVVWRHHGEWWNTLDREEQLFGSFTELAVFVEASQWTQAEGLRYALEANRRRQYANSGSIVWQFNEPFPNVSCTSMVDYYGQPKMVYYYAQRAFAPLHFSLRYDKLLFQPEETFKGEAFIHNALSEERTVVWRIRCFAIDGNELWQENGTSIIAANCTQQVSAILTKAADGVFCIRLEMFDQTGAALIEPNVYTFSSGQEAPFRPLLLRQLPQLAVTQELGRDCELAGQWRSYQCTITNQGTTPAFYVRAEADCGQVIAMRNFTTLLAGETALFEVLWQPGQSDGEAPVLSFKCW